MLPPSPSMCSGAAQSVAEAINQRAKSAVRLGVRERGARDALCRWSKPCEIGSCLRNADVDSQTGRGDEGCGKAEVHGCGCDECDEPALRVWRDERAIVGPGHTPFFHHVALDRCFHE